MAVLESWRFIRDFALSVRARTVLSIQYGRET